MQRVIGWSRPLICAWSRGEQWLKISRFSGYSCGSRVSVVMRLPWSLWWLAVDHVKCCAVGYANEAWVEQEEKELSLWVCCMICKSDSSKSTSERRGRHISVLLWRIEGLVPLWNRTSNNPLILTLHMSSKDHIPKSKICFIEVIY